MLIICSFVCLAQQRNSAMASVSGHSAAGPPGLRVSQMHLSRENFTVRQIYDSNGSLLVAPTDARHL